MDVQEYQIYKFRDFLPLEETVKKIEFLTQNPKAVSFLETHLEDIGCESCLSSNSGAMPILEKDPSFIDWVFLACNPNAIFMIEKNLDSIDWDSLIQNKIYIKKLIIHLLYHSFPHRKFLPDKYCQNGLQLSIEDLHILFWNMLSSNPNAIPLLEKNKEKINWGMLSINPEGISILEKYPEKIHWTYIRENPNAMPILIKYPNEYSHFNWSKWSEEDHIKFAEAHPDRGNWIFLSACSKAIHLLEKYPDKICWASFCKNLHPKAILYLQKNMDRIWWDCLSENPNAMSLLEQFPENINWFYLSENPGALSLLRSNPHKIYWFKLCRNPKAHLLNELLEENIKNLHWDLVLENKGLVSFIKKHPDKIDWEKIILWDMEDPFWIVETYKEFIDVRKLPKASSCFPYYSDKYVSQQDIWTDPRIFEIDRTILQNRINVIREELMALNFTPERISKWKEDGLNLVDCI